MQRLGSLCIFGLPSKEAKMVLFSLMLYGNTNHYVVVAQELISLCSLSLSTIIIPRRNSL